MDDPRFRDISVIMSFNVHRDKINDLGKFRYAMETGQELKTFYSHDTWKGFDNTNQTKKRRVKKSVDPLRTSDDIAMHLQKTIWDILNGAEATVVGWKSIQLKNEYDVLQTVFVRLSDPPVQIRLEGLPPNVVPVSKQTIDIRCELPNGSHLSISREQVPIIGNFAMTDFGSQERTRPWNVVDPHNC
jgi:hypothetical protein